MKQVSKKPMKQGRYWWKEPDSAEAKLVFIEQQALGLYVMGKGWLPWQTGHWSELVGELEGKPENN